MESLKFEPAAQVPEETVVTVEQGPSALEQFEAEEEMLVTEYPEGPAAKPARAFKAITELAKDVRSGEAAAASRDLTDKLAA